MNRTDQSILLSREFWGRIFWPQYKILSVSGSKSSLRISAKSVERKVAPTSDLSDPSLWEPSDQRLQRAFSLSKRVIVSRRHWHDLTLEARLLFSMEDYAELAHIVAFICGFLPWQWSDFREGHQPPKSHISWDQIQSTALINDYDSDRPIDKRPQGYPFMGEFGSVEDPWGNEQERAVTRMIIVARRDDMKLRSHDLFQCHVRRRVSVWQKVSGNGLGYRAFQDVYLISSHQTHGGLAMICQDMYHHWTICNDKPRYAREWHEDQYRMVLNSLPILHTIFDPPPINDWQLKGTALAIAALLVFQSPVQVILPKLLVRTMTRLNSSLTQLFWENWARWNLRPSQIQPCFARLIGYRRNLQRATLSVAVDWPTKSQI
jgi:hypothetical protein